MAEKRQKKQAAKAFEKETFSKDKEVTLSLIHISEPTRR